MTTNTNNDHTLTKQLHILTLNVNGLHNDSKRMEIFQTLNNRNIDIAFLHSGPILKASGVAILLKENLDLEIIHSETDLSGQILKCVLQFEQEIFQLVNIYASAKPTNKGKGNNIILAGDFNMIEDKFLDKLGGSTNNTNLIGLNKLIEIKNEHKLVDIWRKNNPFKRIFTYHNHDQTIHSRLDRIYISKAIKTKTCKIIPTSLSDHDVVSVILQISEENPRGPGIWKLNTSIS